MDGKQYIYPHNSGLIAYKDSDWFSALLQAGMNGFLRTMTGIWDAKIKNRILVERI